MIKAKKSYRKGLFVLKVKLAIALAVIAAIITIIMGFVNHARMIVILYRTVISIALFGTCGYIMGLVYEKNLLPYCIKLLKEEEVGSKLDIQSSPDEDSIIESEDEIDSEKNKGAKNDEFAPFTTNNLRRVKSPEE